MSTAKPFNFFDLLADPNTQQALAGMGAQLDPDGAGGVIGNAASRLISSKAAQSAAAKQLANAQAERDEMRQQHRELINRLGPITPSHEPGPNSIKHGSNRTVNIEGNFSDAGKLIATLGGFSPLDQEGVNSITRTPGGATLVNYTLPKARSVPSVADEVSDLAAAPTAVRDNSRLSYDPPQPLEIAGEVSDLLDPWLPKRRGGL